MSLGELTKYITTELLKQFPFSLIVPFGIILIIIALIIGVIVLIVNIIKFFKSRQKKNFDTEN